MVACRALRRSRTMAALNTSGSCAPGITTRLTPPPSPSPLPPSPPPPSPPPPIVLFGTESSKYLRGKERKGEKRRKEISSMHLSFHYSLPPHKHTPRYSDTTRPCTRPEPSALPYTLSQLFFSSISTYGTPVRTGYRVGSIISASATSFILLSESSNSPAPVMSSPASADASKRVCRSERLSPKEWYLYE